MTDARKIYEATSDWPSKLKDHLVKATALTTSTLPVYALAECAAGMSSDNSLTYRWIGAATFFLALGTVYEKGMQWCRSKFNLNRQAKGDLLSDGLYGMAYNFATSIILYSAVENSSEIVTGTAIMTGIGAFQGILTGYTIDAFRDFAGIEPSKKLPVKVAETNRSGKLALAGLVTATSLGVTSIIYDVNDYYRNSRENLNVSSVQTAAQASENPIRKGTNYLATP